MTCAQAIDEPMEPVKLNFDQIKLDIQINWKRKIKIIKAQFSYNSSQLTLATKSMNWND